jgi:AcrR family transcriptional regulator
MKDYINNKKYRTILDTSRELFWKHGYRRVTVEEICREAKTSKMTFYRFFKNKFELAKTVLDLFFDESLIKFMEIINENSSPSEKMQKILLMKIEGTTNISDEFLQDFYNTPELGLTSYIEEKTEAMRLEIIKLFKAGQNREWIRKDLNVEFFLYFIQKITPVLTDKELLKLFKSPQDLIIECTNLFVYGISPVK